MKQIFLALKYLHLNGYIHRDLKVENLVYADQTCKNIKLIDFGETIRVEMEGTEKYYGGKTV